MTHEALAKAAKLLRLAQSSNPHEASLAAAKAQDIMDRFKLSGADIQLDGSKPAENVMHCPQDPRAGDGPRHVHPKNQPQNPKSEAEMTCTRQNDAL